MNPATLVIASRESRLAMWQAKHVQARLQQIYPSCAVSIHGMTTQGDQILDQPLARIGGKGLFIKELETALANGRAQLAVHSLKDVPYELPPGFALACVLEREQPLDAWVSNRYPSLDDLPLGAVVGTSSLRRQSQLLAYRPDLKIESLRGNLDTRLRKLDSGLFDGIVLASAGLIRLGLPERIQQTIPMHISLPAVGQGVLAIEIAQGEHEPALRQWLAPLNHPATEKCAVAERAVSAQLGASCTSPVAAHACWLDAAQTQMQLTARVVQPNGREQAQHQLTAPITTTTQAQALGHQVGQQLYASRDAQWWQDIGVQNQNA